MFKNILLFLFFISLFSSPAYAAQGNTPFGLVWGMSEKQVKALGVELNMVEEEIFSSKTLPQNMEWIKNYALMIDKNLGLVRIAAYTGDILNDPHGQTGRNIYFRLKSELQQNMVLIYSEEKNAGTPGVAPPPGQTFYACLEEGPCGSWYANFIAGDINAQIILEALDEETGYVSLIYENSALIRQIKQ